MNTVRLPGLLTSTSMQVVRGIAHGRRYPPASVATARFVGQALYALPETAAPTYRQNDG